jgi:hypothetical protein
MQIRITRTTEVATEPDSNGRDRFVRFNEGEVIEARQITKAGNAIVDLGEDYGWTAVVAGSWEMYQRPEHYTTLMVTNGENHVECSCGWSQPENVDHPEPIAALRKSGMTHVRYAEAVR